MQTSVMEPNGATGVDGTTDDGAIEVKILQDEPGWASFETQDGPFKFLIEDLREAVSHCVEPTDAVAGVPHVPLNLKPRDNLIINAVDDDTSEGQQEESLPDYSTGPVPLNERVKATSTRTPVPRGHVVLSMGGDSDMTLPDNHKLRYGKTASGAHWLQVIDTTDEEKAPSDPSEDRANSLLDYPPRDHISDGMRLELNRFYLAEIKDGQLITGPSADNTSSFNYAEHMILGNMLQLPFGRGVTEEARALNLRLHPDNNQVMLTYGQINGLGGDFFGTYEPICLGPSFDDRKRRFLDAFARLAVPSERTRSEVQNIVHNRQEEVDAVWKAKNAGTSTAAAYEALTSKSSLGGMKDDAILTSFTMSRPDRGAPDAAPSYAVLSQMNLDHFGSDARLAYNAGHCCAMDRAASATTKADLEIAYAMNAFADHYLGDCFAAGHIRTPRRELHAENSSWKDTIGFARDMCSKYMHDEDNALGLWVSNPRGNTWQSFGDKRMFERENQTNQEIMLECLQASVNDVFEAYSKGKNEKKPDEYAAWHLAPTLSSAMDKRNHSPLFIKRGDDVMIREDLENPRCYAHHERDDGWFSKKELWPTTYSRLAKSSKLSRY